MYAATASIAQPLLRRRAGSPPPLPTRLLALSLHAFGFTGQSRGSTHAHYFLWLKGAPDLSYLDEWVRDTTTELFGESAQLSEEQVDQIVDELNARALVGVCSCDAEAKECECGANTNKVVDCDCDCHLGEDILGEAPQPCSCECTNRLQAARDANWWSERCTRFNHGWIAEPDGRGRPDKRGKHDPHPAAQRHWEHDLEPIRKDRIDAGGAAPSDERNSSLTAAMKRELADITNACNRHESCTPYCQRRDRKSGKVYCRFEFPHEPRSVNRAHFYAERVKGGIRWRLYLPMNDPLLNSINPYQVLSQRSNCDFSPIIDHFSALEYMTK